LLRRTDIIAIVLDITADPLHQLEETLDILAENRIYPEGEPVPENLPKRPFIKKMMILVNKVDGPGDIEDYEVFRELSETRIPAAGVSTRSGMGLNELLKLIYGLSGVIRVFTKTPGKEPDRNMPFVIPHDSTVEELAGMIHKDFVSKMKYARVWGSTVHGQMVQREYVMQDGDVVEIHM
jgi:ribosome-interacting GTPase 1